GQRAEQLRVAVGAQIREALAECAGAERLAADLAVADRDIDTDRIGELALEILEYSIDRGGEACRSARDARIVRDIDDHEGRNRNSPGPPRRVSPEPRANSLTMRKLQGPHFTNCEVRPANGAARPTPARCGVLPRPSDSPRR